MKSFGSGTIDEYQLDADFNKEEQTFDVVFSIDEKMATKIKKNFIKAQAKILKINGFRKGKAPTGLIVGKLGGKKAAYGASFVTYANAKIVETSPYKVVHTFDFDIDEKSDGSWDVTFKLCLEYPAEINDRLFDMNFQIPKLDPQEYVDYRIAVFARVNPYLRIKETKEGEFIAAAEDDMVEISVKATLDGEAFDHGSHEATNVRLVEGGVNPPSLYQKLLGSFPGSSFKIETTNPEDIPGPFKGDFKNKSSFVIEVTVNRVYTCEDPKIDDDLSISAGYKSMEDWKKSLTDSANRINISREEQLKKTLILDHIVSMVEYPLFPDTWAEAHAKGLIARGKHQDTTHLREELKKVARQTTLLKQIGEYLGVEWDEEEQEKNQYDRNEHAYSSKVMQHLIEEKAIFNYVEPGTEENTGSNRKDKIAEQEPEGSPSSDREGVGGEL